MTSIDAVEIKVNFLYYHGGPDQLLPESVVAAFLCTDPGGIEVGRWVAGILSLDLPDGDRRRLPCSDVDGAISEAMLTWNTTEGFATLERWIGVRRAAATWTGERRHEWKEPKQLVTLVKATIKQAVKDGVLPMPNDYRVSWRTSEDTISVSTKHMWLRMQQISETLRTLLRPFNASKADDVGGYVFGVFGRLDFDILSRGPNEPREDRTLPASEIWALRYAHRIAAMERDGFPAADIDHMRATCVKYAPAA